MHSQFEEASEVPPKARCVPGDKKSGPHHWKQGYHGKKSQHGTPASGRECNFTGSHLPTQDLRSRKGAPKVESKTKI